MGNCILSKGALMSNEGKKVKVHYTGTLDDSSEVRLLRRSRRETHRVHHLRWPAR